MLGFPLLWSLLWCFIRQPGFSIHMSDTFMLQLFDSRICHIRGVLGGGKTSLAFILTHYLRQMDKGLQYVASNVPCDLALFPPPPLGNGIQDTVVILDEAGAYIGNRTWESNPTEFYQALRKLHTVVLCPSKSPLDVRLSELWVQRVFTVGDLCWFYLWGYNLGKDSKDGFFFVWKPSEIFGQYSTAIYSANADDILDLFRVSLERLARSALGWRSYRVTGEEDETWADLIVRSKEAKEARLSKSRWGLPTTQVDDMLSGVGVVYAED